MSRFLSAASVLTTVSVVTALAVAAPPRPRGPHVAFTHAPPHAPNLLIVARAVSIGVAMRAAGLQRVIAPMEAPTTPGTPGQLYTEDPLEQRTQQTRVDPGVQLVPLLRDAWPEIGEQGARTLAAQFAMETGSGRHCYNFNLGNHKAFGKETHMYLRGVWEGLDRRELERMQQSSTFGAFVHEESAADIRKNGHLVPPGKTVVILDPPHPGARFRANLTLEAGVERFAAHHRRIAEKSDEFVVTLRAGDCRGVARILGSPKIAYFTGNVDAYAQGMTNHRDIIDEGLGPILDQ